MSTKPCAVCGPKRLSRALCNCCEQYLCRDHLKEHDDLVNAQLLPLADSINELVERLQQFDVNSHLQPARIELDRWKQSAFQSIERIYEQKCLELDALIGKELDHLREKTSQIQKNVSQLIQEQDGTNEQIQSLTTAMQNIEREMNEIQNPSVQFDIRPLVVDDDCIRFRKENSPPPHKDQFVLTPSIQSIPSTSINVDCVGNNSTQIMLHRHPTLCLYDFNLNLSTETLPYSDLSVTDLCWSSTLNRFIILTDEDVFVLDQTKMILDKCNIPTRLSGHWHNMTCSSTSLYLTVYKWGTHIYQYEIRSSSPTTFEFNRRLATPNSCTKDESIDHLIHTDDNHMAMIIQNRVNNNKHFQLRNDQTLECLWSFELVLCQLTLHRHRFCSVNGNEWLIIDSDQSILLYISHDGSLKQIIPYPYNRPLRALEIKPNFLLFTTERSVDLHQLL